MIRKVKKKLINILSDKNFSSIFRSIGIVFLLLLFLNLGNFSLSRYESEANIDVSPRLAFFIIDVGTYNDSFELGKILPSTNPYLYTFNVSNFKGDRRINVNLEYDIELVSTTNLPLNIKVFKSGTPMSGSGIIATDTITNDDDGMYFRSMAIGEVFNFSYTQNKTDEYVLWIEFPESYKYNSEDYEGVLELIEIKVNARQIV